MGGGIHVWWIAWGVGMGASGAGSSVSFAGFLQFHTPQEQYQFTTPDEKYQFRTVKT